MATLNELNARSVDLHRLHQGSFAQTSLIPLETREDLAVAYTPGIAAVCQAIHASPEEAYALTIKGRSVAVVTDGTSVLGLGDIGPEAALPVMEGKSLLFKKFGNIDAYPICLATKEVDEIVETVVRIAPGFAGINLEDIAAPACFEVERKLRERLSIPVIHDDQHGTAIVVLAGLLNALKVVGKERASAKVVLMGAGAAGLATAHLLIDAGIRNLTLVDSKGILAPGREDMNTYKDDLAQKTNPTGKRGSLTDALQGADVFIGVSRANLLTTEMVQSMAEEAIIFALANPIPEILPDVARAAGAHVVATGRSDFPNQVNNALVFPGLFRGLIDARRSQVRSADFVAAAEALAALVEHPTAEKIIPSLFDEGVAQAIAQSVAKEGHR